MECTRESVGQLGVDDILEAVSAIYGTHDRTRSLWDVWSHALHHAAAVAEEIRKRHLPGAVDEKLEQEIADLALWFFTIVGKLRGPLGSSIDDQPPQDWIVRISVGASDLMWNRYPGICPWCHFNGDANASSDIDESDLWRPCSCDALSISAKKKDKGALRTRAKRMRMLASKYVSRKPHSLDEWQEWVGILYGSRLNQMSLTEVALHLLEEMGEVSDGLVRMYSYLDSEPVEHEIIPRQIRLEDELADVLSWLMGLVERLGKQRQFHTVEGHSVTSSEVSKGKLVLSDLLWKKYGSDEKGSFWCRHCSETICTCRIRLIQSEQQVQELLTKLSDRSNAADNQSSLGHKDDR
jgi:NTP pyrophosphatase (non-canonical NTP hydrolase)